MIKRFNRYELKYIINSRQYHGLCQDLKNFMIPDAYGDGDGFYRIVSLYYDSPTYSGYWSKIEGLKFRRKLRLRVYPGTDPSKITTGFVEIKQRLNRTVQKKRVILPIDEAERLCNFAEVPRGLDARDTEAAEEMAYMVRSLGLRPAAIVSYRRHAWMGGQFEKGMRLTFDMQLQGRMNSLNVRESAKVHYFLPPDAFVMEVKVNERVPAWVTSVLAQHDCQLGRISKYCSVVSHEMKSLKTALEHKENIYG
jgi:hypothetical protein